MATDLARAKSIVAGLLNKTVAEVTPEMVNRAGRALAYRAEPLTGLAAYDALTDVEKLRFFLTRSRSIYISAVKSLDISQVAPSAIPQVQAAVETEFSEGP